jgi:pimeloyl-ACP methyl ester carboxylesterase
MRMSRILFLIVVVSIAIFGYYTIRVTSLFFLQYSKFHPPHEQIHRTEGKFDSRLHDIAIDVGDGTHVAGWSLPSNNGATIIFVHGVTANRNQLLPIAAVLNEHGYGALLLDMPGHGESGGRADWGISSQRAVERAIDLALKEDGVRHIGLFAFSMGACIAAQVAAQNDRVNALVLLAAYTNLADELRYNFRSRIPFFGDLSVLATRMAGVDVSNMQTLDILRGSTSPPVFIVSGTVDRSIPVSMPRTLFQAAHEPKELWLVDGADHGDERDTAGHAIFDERVRIFLDKALFGRNVDLSHL